MNFFWFLQFFVKHVPYINIQITQSIEKKIKSPLNPSLKIITIKILLYFYPVVMLFTFLLSIILNVLVICDVGFLNFKNRGSRIKITNFFMCQTQSICMILRVCNVQNRQMHRDRKCISGHQGPVNGDMGWLTMDMGFCFQVDENFLKLFCDDGCTNLNKKKKNTELNIMWRDFMVCALHLNKAILKRENFYMSPAANLPTSLNLYQSILSPSFKNEWTIFTPI